MSVHAEGSWDLEEQIVQKKIKRIGKGAYIDLEVHCASVSAYHNAYERPSNNTNWRVERIELTQTPVLYDREGPLLLCDPLNQPIVEFRRCVGYFDDIFLHRDSAVGLNRITDLDVRAQV